MDFQQYIMVILCWGNYNKLPRWDSSRQIFCNNFTSIILKVNIFVYLVSKFFFTYVLTWILYSATGRPLYMFRATVRFWSRSNLTFCQAYVPHFVTKLCLNLGKAKPPSLFRLLTTSYKKFIEWYVNFTNKWRKYLIK